MPAGSRICKKIRFTYYGKAKFFVPLHPQTNYYIKK